MNAAPWTCDDCGWEWPFAGEPPENAECDNCGGPLDAPREQSAVQAGVLRDLDVEVCQFCSDIECDGVACIAALDPDDVSDHPKIERLHTMLATANGLSAAMHRSWVERDRLEAEMMQVLDERDRYHDWAERWKNEVARLTEGIRAHAAWGEPDECVDRDMALWALVAPSVAPSVEPDRRRPSCGSCATSSPASLTSSRTGSKPGTPRSGGGREGV